MLGGVHVLVDAMPSCRASASVRLRDGFPTVGVARKVADASGTSMQAALTSSLLVMFVTVSVSLFGSSACAIYPLFLRAAMYIHDLAWPIMGRERVRPETPAAARPHVAVGVTALPRPSPRSTSRSSAL